MTAAPLWKEKGFFYYPLSLYLRETFGEPVRKVSVDAGFSCPNIDGTVGSGGCIFCNNRSFSPSRRLNLPDIDAQIEESIARISARYKTQKYIAYFQPSTNTYAPVEKLEIVYRQALAHPEIAGLAIGTRPDTVPDDVLDLIADISRQIWVSLELGLQTASDRSLRFLNRGHDYASFADAVSRAQKRGIQTCAHIILGIPGETREEMLQTARLTASMHLHSLKLHNLYVVRETALADLYTSGKITLMPREEYIQTVADFLELTPPDTVIERLAGDAPRDFLIAPDWSGAKTNIKNSIEEEFRKRGSYQGIRFKA